MGLLDRFKFNQTTPTSIPLVSTLNSNNDVYLVNQMDFSELNSFVPRNTFSWYGRGGGKYMPYGRDNLFPLQLQDLYYSSPLNSTILEMKSKMMAGYIDLSTKDTRSIAIINQMFGIGTSLSYKLREVSLDWQIFGAFALEVIWNANFTAIAKVNRLPVMNVRCGIENQKREIDKYYFSNDWRITQYQPFEMAKFDVNDKVNQSQLLYVKNPSLDGRYYGIPGYASGLNSIAADAAISVYQLAVVENGFNPGIIIKFFKKPNSPEQQREIINGLDRTYGGKKKAGKVMVLFSDGKDLAPEVTPVDVSNLDKQFTVLESSISEKVIYSHNAVSGILYGREVAGKLGSSNEYINAFNILDNIVISPDRILLQETINNLLSINGASPITINTLALPDIKDAKSLTPTG